MQNSMLNLLYLLPVCVKMRKVIMISPPKPKNESERVEALHRLNILDTGKDERFDRITRIACKLFEVPIALVSLVDSERQWFKSSCGLDAEETPRTTSFCGHAILSDEIMIVENATEDERFSDNPFVLGDPNVRFYLGCPLKIKEYNVGTLCLIDTKPREFKQTDLGVMRDLADMVQLELESLHLSTTDDLTGLSNRRGFLKIAEHVVKLCQRENKIVTLLFFDLDKFKQINDTFGHEEGNNVLKIFSKLLLQNFRHSDVVARLGGDEFCVLCSGLDEDNLPALIDRFQCSLEALEETKYQIQFSVGSIQFDKENHETIENLLERADSEMYRDKKRNRNE